MSEKIKVANELILREKYRIANMQHHITIENLGRQRISKIKRLKNYTAPENIDNYKKQYLYR